MLSKLTDATLIFEQSWQLERLNKDCRNENVTSIFKKGEKEDPEVYILVSLTLIPRNVRKQLILEIISFA